MTNVSSDPQLRSGGIQGLFLKILHEKVGYDR